MRYIAISLMLVLFFFPASVGPIHAQDTQQAVPAVKPAQANPAASVAPAAGNAVPAVPPQGPASTAPAGGNAAGNGQTPSPFNSIIIPLLLAMVVIYVFMFSGKGREEKKRKAMLSALKRGDRVVTMGGLIASVVDVRDDEVVLKVDESANVKERYTRSSIVSIINPSDEADKK